MKVQLQTNYNNSEIVFGNRKAPSFPISIRPAGVYVDVPQAKILKNPTPSVGFLNRILSKFNYKIVRI